MISGGDCNSDPAGKTVEIFVPSTNQSCEAPVLPGGPSDQHHYHILEMGSEGPLLCGGDYAADSCGLLSSGCGPGGCGSEWLEFVSDLQETREYPVSWNTTSGVYLLGDGETTELVKPDGTSAASFSLKYPIE